VNDVSAGRHDPDMFRVVADLGVPMVLMHMRGTPETMRSMASYDESRGGVVAEVSRELEERCQAAEAAGIHRWMQILDPGIGFAKTLPQNLQRNSETARIGSDGAAHLAALVRRSGGRLRVLTVEPSNGGLDPAEDCQVLCESVPGQPHVAVPVR
jgi:dihydropteroate synthase